MSIRELAGARPNVRLKVGHIKQEMYQMALKEYPQAEDYDVVSRSRRGKMASYTYTYRDAHDPMLLKDWPMNYQQSLPQEMRDSKIWDVFGLHEYRGRTIYDLAPQDMLDSATVQVLYTVTPNMLGLPVKPPPSAVGDKMKMARYKDLMQKSVGAYAMTERPVQGAESFSMLFTSPFRAQVRNVLKRAYLKEHELLTVVSNSNHFRYFAFAYFLMETGCRREEALLMNIDDFHPKEQAVTIPIAKQKGKVGPKRTVPISQDAVKVLTRWIASDERTELVTGVQEQEYATAREPMPRAVAEAAVEGDEEQMAPEEAFAYVTEEAAAMPEAVTRERPPPQYTIFPMNGDIVADQITGLGFKSGIQWMYAPRQNITTARITLNRTGRGIKVGRHNIRKFGAHVFRASFINNLVNNGIDILTVSKLAGHASIEITQGYLDIGISPMQESAVRAYIERRRPSQ